MKNLIKTIEQRKQWNSKMKQLKIKILLILNYNLMKILRKSNQKKIIAKNYKKIILNNNSLKNKVMKRYHNCNLKAKLISSK